MATVSCLFIIIGLGLMLLVFWTGSGVIKIMNKSIQINKRIAELGELDDLLKDCKLNLDNILNELGWNDSETVKTCNTNSNNTPTSKRDETLVDNNDLPLPESFDWTNSVQIDKSIIKEICNADKDVPHKFSDLQLNFTTDDKLKLYNYVIESTVKLAEPEMTISLPESNSNEKRLTFAEIVAIKKAEKKKKRKYRVSKPTHVEEVRSLVDLQMQALQQYIEQERRGSGRNDFDDYSRKSSCNSRSRLEFRKRSRSPSEDRRKKRSRHDQYELDRNRRESRNHKSDASSYDKDHRHREEKNCEYDEVKRKHKKSKHHKHEYESSRKDERKSYKKSKRKHRSRSRS